MTNRQAPLEAQHDLIHAIVSSTIFQLMKKSERNEFEAFVLSAVVIGDVKRAWTTLLETEPQASQWSANTRYLRTRAILVQQKHDVGAWSTEYEIVRYLVWALAPQERIERGTNLLHGPKAALETKLATYLAQRGTPKASDEVYGWADSDKQFHTRVCSIVHISEVHEDKWEQFNDTFSPNSTQHGLTGTGTCRCGYVDGELRVQVDLSQMLNELLKVEA